MSTQVSALRRAPTFTRTWPGPTMGSSSATRALSCRARSAAGDRADGRRRRLPSAARQRVSDRPNVSRMTTDSGRSDSTLPATRPVMPLRSPARAADFLQPQHDGGLGGLDLSANSESFPSRCGRAHSRLRSVPNRPRQLAFERAAKLTCSRNSVVPNAGRSKISKPMRPPTAGRRRSSDKRSSSTRSAGTLTARPPSV